MGVPHPWMGGTPSLDRGYSISWWRYPIPRWGGTPFPGWGVPIPSLDLDGVPPRSEQTENITFSICLSPTTVCSGRSMISRGEGAKPKGRGASLLFWSFFPEHCLKIKEIGPRGWGVHGQWSREGKPPHGLSRTISSYTQVLVICCPDRLIKIPLMKFYQCGCVIWWQETPNCPLNVSNVKNVSLDQYHQIFLLGKYFSSTIIGDLGKGVILGFFQKH